jgi:hypothetical protein
MEWNEVLTFVIVSAVIVAIALVTRGRTVPRDPTEASRHHVSPRDEDGGRHAP